MANKPLQTIKFPGLTDTYTVPQVDSNFVGTAGQVPDSKKVHDEIDSLKEDLIATNAEVMDIRVGADGTTYNSAGDAVRGQISDLKEDFNAAFDYESQTVVNKITQESTDLTYYGNGCVNTASNGRYSEISNYDTYLWTPTETTDVYIENVGSSGNDLRLVEYNKTLTSLPTSSSNSDYVRSGIYTSKSSNTLPTASDKWTVPAGHTIAISRVNSSTHVSDFDFYYTAEGEAMISLRETVVIPTASVVHNDVIKTLQNNYYNTDHKKWSHAQKTGTHVIISEDNPINVTFDSVLLTSVIGANLFDISTVGFTFNSSTPNATKTKTETGVKVESTDTSGSNKFVYFSYTAPYTGRLWISCDAKCDGEKTNDCRLIVLQNGDEIAPQCIGMGKLKRYVDVTAGDTIQVRLWYHLYTSTSANTVEYSNIMISYSDADYIPYGTASKDNITKGSILLFSESTTVEYEYTEWNNPLKCVCFGDSVTGMFDNGADYCSILSRIAPVDCVNVGFSGSTWADHPSTHYIPFSINRLIEAVVSDDFTYQDAHVESITSAFYADHLAALKSIDFSDVDVVTFLAGTNDWAFNIPLLTTDTEETENKQRYDIEDAVLYSISELLVAFPHLVIIVLTPYWRANDMSQLNDSNYTPNSNGVYLYQVCSVIKTCAESNNVRCENLYYTLGANWKTRYIYTIDGTHPTARTKNAIAQRIKAAIDVSGI